MQLKKNLMKTIQIIETSLAKKSLNYFLNIYNFERNNFLSKYADG